MNDQALASWLANYECSTRQARMIKKAFDPRLMAGLGGAGLGAVGGLFMDEQQPEEDRTPFSSALTGGLAGGALGLGGAMAFNPPDLQWLLSNLGGGAGGDAGANQPPAQSPTGAAMATGGAATAADRMPAPMTPDQSMERESFLRQGDQDKSYNVLPNIAEGLSGAVDSAKQMLPSPEAANQFGRTLGAGLSDPKILGGTTGLMAAGGLAGHQVGRALTNPGAIARGAGMVTAPPGSTPPQPGAKPGAKAPTASGEFGALANMISNGHHNSYKNPETQAQIPEATAPLDFGSGDAAGRARQFQGAFGQSTLGSVTPRFLRNGLQRLMSGKQSPTVPLDSLGGPSVRSYFQQSAVDGQVPQRPQGDRPSVDSTTGHLKALRNMGDTRFSKTMRRGVLPALGAGAGLAAGAMGSAGRATSLANERAQQSRQLLDKFPVQRTTAKP